MDATSLDTSVSDTSVALDTSIELDSSVSFDASGTSLGGDASAPDASELDAAMPMDGSVAGYVYGDFEGPACDVTGSTTSFTVRLAAVPSASVTIPVGIVGAPATVAPFTLTFTTETWAQPQRITIAASGADVSADTPYTVLLGTPTTADPIYASQDPEDVALTLCDHGNDAVLVRASGGGALTLPLETDKSGEQARFEVVLAAAPSAEVRVALAASIDDQVAFATSALVFDTTTWNVPQTVTLSGLLDASPTTITSLTLTLTPTSDDFGYAALAPIELHVRNREVRTNVALDRSVTLESCSGLCTLWYDEDEIVDGSLERAAALISATPSPTFVIDLGKVYTNPIITVNCLEGPFQVGNVSGAVARPPLGVASTGASTGVPYTMLTPVQVQRGVRYVRLSGMPVGGLHGVACLEVTVMAHPLD